MFGRKRGPRLRDVVREMAGGSPAELRSPEEIDVELDEEAAEALEEDKVVDPIDEGSERAIQEMQEAEEIHRDLVCGSIFLSAVLLIGMIWARPIWRYAVGVVIGGGVAVYLLVHMYRSIGWELTMDPQEADRYARKRAALRYVVVLLAIVAVMIGLGKAAGIGCAIAIIMIKPAAYLQPTTAKIRKKLGFRKG